MNRLGRSIPALLTLAGLTLAGCPSEPAAGRASTTAIAPTARPAPSSRPPGPLAPPPPASAVVDRASPECSAFGATSDRCFRTAAEACADIHCPTSSCVLTTLKPSIAVCDNRDPVGIQVGAPHAFEVVAGTSCAGHGDAVAPERAKLRKDPTTSLWTTHETWSCGCAKGSVLTLVYEPRTSPLRVHLCKDQSADLCQMLCGGPVAWDLGKPMREAGATTAELAL